MEITVCASSYERLVITDHALVCIQVTTPEEAKSRAAAHFFGGLLGAAIAGDGGSLLGGGQMSILNLGDGTPVPPLHHIKTVVKCFASEVPDDLAQSGGWPKVAPFRQVVFYPRLLIGEVSLSWSGRLRVTFPGVAPDFTTRVDLLSMWRAKDALRRWGYPLR